MPLTFRLLRIIIIKMENQSPFDIIRNLKFFSRNYLQSIHPQPTHTHKKSSTDAARKATLCFFACPVLRLWSTVRLAAAPSSSAAVCCLRCCCGLLLRCDILWPLLCFCCLLALVLYYWYWWNHWNIPYL